MATSGTTDYSVTRDDIIKRALRLIGVLAQGETPTTAQVDEGAVALNGLVKAWAADGMPLWSIKTLNVPLVAAQAKYQIGNNQPINSAKPLKLLQAYNRDSVSNVDIPIRIITQQEYTILGNKTSSGNPIQVYYDPRRDIGELYVFPVPGATEAANNSIYMIAQFPFEDFDSSTNNPDFPQEWYDALTYGLAVRLAPEYGVPSSDRKTLFQEMTLIKQEALNFGLEEGSLYFQVDRRSW